MSSRGGVDGKRKRTDGRSGGGGSFKGGVREPRLGAVDDEFDGKRHPRPAFGREGDAAGQKDGKRRRRDDGDDGDDEEAQPDVTAEVHEEAGEDGDVGGGFAAALQKVMRRTITGEGKAAAPVMAKRHTAALKLSNKEKAEKRDEKRAKKARQASRLAHLALPQEMPIENELKLRKLATKGVVALFNAITKHQKALAAAQVQAAVSAESGPSSAAASGSAASGSAAGSAGGGGGRSFLELLRQTAAQAAEGKAAAAKAAPVAAPSVGAAAGAGGPGRPGWSVLEDDYLETREEDDDAEGGAGGGGFDEDGAVGGKAVSVKSKRAAAAAAAARAASATRGRTELPDILGDSSDSD